MALELILTETDPKKELSLVVPLRRLLGDQDTNLVNDDRYPTVLD